MTEYVYKYSILIFEHGYEPVQLCKEINNDPNISQDVSRINVENADSSDPILEIYFLQELSDEEITALDAVIEAHIPAEDSDYQFADNLDLMGYRILNHGTPINDLDGINKIYVDLLVDQKSNNAEQNAKAYIDQKIADVLDGMLDFDESQLDINKLSGRPSGNLVGTTASQELSNKTINGSKNVIINLDDSSIKDDAMINVIKLANGTVNNVEFQRLAGIKSNIQTQIDQNTSKSDAHAARKDNPHVVTKAQVGLGNLLNIKSNLDAVRIPNSMDDIVAGFSVGSFWINRNTNVGYICTDNTELNAKWLEITSLGEITQGLNVGEGIGIYLDKIGAVHRFRSLIPGNNVFFDERTQDITIRSRDSHSFLLSPIEIEITQDEYKGILFFPWLKTEFGSYQSGKLIFETMIDTGTMSIKLRNMTENSVLGEMLNISESGFYELMVANPPDNARVKVEVKKTGVSNGSDNPRIFGIVLKYQS